MAGLILGSRARNTQPTVYDSIQLQNSAQGIPVPVYYGTNRGAPNLIWYAGFTRKAVSTGGKGGAVAAATGKGGQAQYVYSADIILAMCEGPIQGYGQAWASKTPTTISALGLTTFTGTYPQAIWSYVTTNYPGQDRPYTGLAYLGGAQYQLGSSAELPAHTFEIYGVFSQRTVYVDTSIPGSSPYTVTVGNRTWANGSTVNLWVSDVSVVSGVTTFTKVGGAPGLNQYSVAAGVYTFNSGNAGASIEIAFTGKGQDADPSLVVNDVLTNVDYGTGFTTAQVGELNAYNETFTIPGSPYQVSVANASGFDDNLSVYAAGSDTLFTCVASSPGQGQYSFSAGTYTFNSADSGTSVQIAYSANVGLKTFQQYTWAAGLFVSPIYRSQTTAATVLDEIANYTNSEVVWNGSLKLVPRGDTSLTANGFTYTPPSTQADFSDDQFQIAHSGASGGASGNAADPVIATRKRVADQKNVVQVEVLDRSNQYNAAMVEATDQAAVDLYGRRTTGSQSGHIFCDTTIGRASAQLLLQKQALRTQYDFSLDARWVWLDPMDLVTITDGNLGLSQAIVRILSMEEQDDGTINVTAEEYPGTVGSAQSYSFSQASGYAANYSADPGSVNTPKIFEASVQIASNSGLEMWAAVSGANSLWGGCDVYVSSDNSTYSFVGRKWGASRMGTLTGTTSASFGVLAANDINRTQRVRIDGEFNTVGKVPAAGVALGMVVAPNLIIRSQPVIGSGWGTGTIFNNASDPDTSDTFSVDLTESFGALTSGTHADADVGNTLCIVDDELFSYSTATLTATYKYNLTGYLRRGQFNTAIAAHSAGAIFARLDENIFAIPYDKSQVGKTVYVKFASFNIWGGGLQDLSVATAYSHTIVGPPLPGTVQNFTVTQNGLAAVLSWTDLSDPSIKGYDILYGAQGGSIATATLLTNASRTTETTTQQVGAGSWTFYIRTRNIADQTGPVSTANATISAFSQVFTAVGTAVWTKPTGVTSASMTIIECWGGGGGGGVGNGSGGGGGGGYNRLDIQTSRLGATESVSVGGGGAAGNNSGQLSTFGSWLTAYGGGYGESAASQGGGGGGGGQTGGALGYGHPGAGGNGGDGGQPANGFGGIITTGPACTGGFSGGGGADGTSAVSGAAGMWGGGGGGGGGGSNQDGGASVMGGGGGGGGIGSGGVSDHGGNGGNHGAAGTAPGGGGGRGSAGASGQVRVTVIP